MVERFVAQLSRDRPILPPPEPERKLRVVTVVVRHAARIRPVVARVIDDDVENDAHRRSASMRRVDEVDEVLLGTEVRIDVQIVADVVAVVRALIVLEDRGEPDRRTSQSGDVIEVLRDPADRAAVEVIRHPDAGGATGLPDGRSRGAVVETIDEQEVDELLSPLPCDVEIGLVWSWRKIDVLEVRR